MLTGDSGIVGELVGEVGEAWPNGFDALLKKITSLNRKNSGPHQGNEC